GPRGRDRPAPAAALPPSGAPPGRGRRRGPGRRARRSRPRARSRAGFRPRPLPLSRPGLRGSTAAPRADPGRGREDAPSVVGMRPFLLLASRAEDPAADGEHAAVLRYSGLDAGALHRVRMEAGPLPAIDLDDYSGVIVGGSPFDSSL